MFIQNITRKKVSWEGGMTEYSCQSALRAVVQNRSYPTVALGEMANTSVKEGADLHSTLRL
jgi:hypothetical protein